MFHAVLRVEGRDSRAWRVAPETECSFAARLGAGAAGTCGMCRSVDVKRRLYGGVLSVEREGLA